MKAAKAGETVVSFLSRPNNGTVAMLAIATFFLLMSPARADVIRLQSGGELRGTLDNVREAGQAQSIEITTLSGATVEVSREQVEFVKSRTPEMEEYVTRSRELPHTVEDHRALAEWCLLHGLTTQREEQLWRLLDIDPDHEEARRALRHEFYRGEWMPQEEAMALQGYYRHDGRWVTQQELDLINKTAAQRAAEQVWHPQVRLWVGWLTEVRNKEAEGLRNLQQINDPAAIPALVSFMADHDSASVRGLMVSILREIGGEDVVEPLVAQMLFDVEPDVQVAALESLTPDQYELALDYLVPELRNRDNAVVRRVAVALTIIGDERTVPYLIDSLITSHTYQIMIPAGTSQAFARGPNGQMGMLTPGSAAALSPELDLALRSGQLPYGAIVLPPFGGRGQRMQSVTVSTEVSNAEVLVALETITGQDFGYSEVDWRAWWNFRRQQEAG
jgi:hypothetical protein